MKMKKYWCDFDLQSVKIFFHYIIISVQLIQNINIL